MLKTETTPGRRVRLEDRVGVVLAPLTRPTFATNEMLGDGADLIYGKEGYVIVLLDPEDGKRGWVEIAHDADNNIISVRVAGGTGGRGGKRVLAKPAELVPE